MPFLRRALATAALFVTLTTAQTCYYPDGTESADTPCGSGSQATSCCGSSAFCLDNGLCYSEGVVSRGSCTDKTWDSPECAGYCRTISASSAVSIIPCPSLSGNNLFACGLDQTSCSSNSFTMSNGSSFILRPAQVAALVQPALDANSTASSNPSTITVTAAANATGLHTSGEMAGLGIGLAIPLLFVSAIAFYLYRRDRDRTPKLMYPLPDDCKDDYFIASSSSASRRLKPSAPPSIQMQPPAYHRSPKDSDAQSLHTLHSAHSAQPPTHMMSFMERYQAIKENLRIQDRVELEATSTEPFRHELGDRRMSTKSARSFQSVKTAKSGL